MSKYKKTVSVIVPMYNVQGLIGETVESLKKNKSNIEFLLIDDGSTDNTYEAAKRAIGYDYRFKIFRQINQGVSVARNLGLKKAKGEYVMFVDSDDLLSESAIDKLYFAAKENGADFTYGAVKKFDSKREWTIDAHRRHNVFSPGIKTINKNPEILFFIGVAGKIISRDILDGIYFPIGMKFSEDTVLMFQSFVRAKKIFTISDVVYYYRERDVEQHDASATQNKSKYSFEYFCDVTRSINICKSELYSNSNISDRDKINFLKKYYDRIFAYELWPLFMKSLASSRSKALDHMLGFIDSHSKEEINKIPAIRLYLIKVFIDKIYLLKLNDFNVYRRILNSIFSKLNDDVKSLCRKPEVYGQKWADSELIAEGNREISFLHFAKVKSKKYFWHSIKNNEKKIGNLIFKTAKILPIDTKKVIFATHKFKPVGENFSHVISKVDKKKFKIYKFLGENSSIKVRLLRYYHYATAGVIFLEDYHKPIYGLKFKKSAKIVQLWHACGAFKKFAHAALDGEDSNPIELERRAHSSYTNVITSSKHLNEIYAESFGVSLNSVQDIGVPRTDIFFNKKYIERISTEYEKIFDRNKVNVLYAPTFRGHSSVRGSFFLNIDWSAFDKDFFEKHRLIIKLHPIVKNVYPKIPESLKDKVHVLDSTHNANDLMIFSDILITDYSSLIFEYSLLNKPILYYPYDLDSYYNERGFYFEYNDYVFGEVVFDTKSLKNAILNYEKSMESYSPKREEFIRRFMSSCDGNATRRLISNVFDK
ncbi:CDP-glycerol glycerophosphotransferase family protein [uncultured Comamonas sp.]|uniref:bifunctional glycosyltransferase/CDP-glycerol:glycerophosphate glycerophosphotransferase n=1 Tax=uncultured Comamonas sp. TaxID=114710 RepID=UPI0025FB3149|nr:CDP-glycerol glycerophosphotransferase family protein [uncultured Comamonas sp.]